MSPGNLLTYSSRLNSMHSSTRGAGTPGGFLLLGETAANPSRAEATTSARSVSKMVRGHAKAVAQAKNQAKMADKAASMKRDGSESRQVKEAGITMVCSVCKQGMPNIGALRSHFENKHPKSPLPPELTST